MYKYILGIHTGFFTGGGGGGGGGGGVCRAKKLTRKASKLYTSEQGHNFSHVILTSQGKKNIEGNPRAPKVCIKPCILHKLYD